MMHDAWFGEAPYKQVSFWIETPAHVIGTTRSPWKRRFNPLGRQTKIQRAVQILSSLL